MSSYVMPHPHPHSPPRSPATITASAYPNPLADQWQKWLEISLSHQNIALFSMKEKLSEISQSRDPLSAQRVIVQMVTEQFSNAAQFTKHLWSAQVEAQQQWNQIATQWMHAQHQVSSDNTTFPWQASTSPAELAHAMTQSALSLGHHFINGSDRQN